MTGNITHESTGATTVNVSVLGDVVSLGASVAALNAGFTTINTPGNPVSYDLTGDGLINATLVTVPVGYEVASSAAGPWGPTLNIATMPSYQQTVYVRLDGLALGNFAGDVVNASAPATVNIPITGDVMPPNNLHTLRMGPNSSILVDNNSQGPDGMGIVLLDFTVSTINSPWTGTDITFAASGTADEQAGISSLILYEDHPVNGTQGGFDGEFVDTIATPGPGVSFNGPNGIYTATFSNTSFPVMTTRRFFLVAKLAGKAIAGETMHVEVQNVVATGVQGQVTGVPTAHPSDALEINTAKALLSLSGPVVFQTVDNNAQGPNGDGIPVCVFRFIPTNETWNVSSFTFTESGTMDGQADISSLALYIDNGNGQWDGPATDLLATAATGVNFNGPDGIYTAGLTAAASTFTVNQAKRFILVAKLSGSASTGETLRVSVSAIVQSAPSGGTLTGVPSGATSALMIDQPTLTVNAGPANPTTITREKSAAGFAEMIGQFRLSARNSAFTVSGMTLHTAGNGDWLNHLDPATGVQVFRDNGNGSFDAGDILLSSNPGATPSVPCVFTTNQNIAVNTDVDLWVVLNVLPSAGGSPYETFQAMIESASDINSLTAGGTVKLGTLTPETGVLRVVDFSVDDFTPTVGLFAGGASIKIEGSGFALPVTVTIGGVPCTGTASVDAAGTLISGLSVPSGTGSNLAIVLTTNNLPPKTLTQTFRYSNILPNPNVGGTTKPADSSSCTAAPAASLAMLALPALAMFGLRRRRK